MSDKVGCIIPARYESSRLPGKPLIDLNGKPMIVRVAERVKKTDIHPVLVATDSNEIARVCHEYGITYAMTSEFETGSDRVASVTITQGLDYWINVQGDEPLLPLDNIEKVKEELLTKKYDVVNAMTIATYEDITDDTVVKVATNRENRLIYMSRHPIPFSKNEADVVRYKQVGVYGFSFSALKRYHHSQRGKLELSEDVEILRFVENGIPVQMVEVDEGSISVDTEKDAEKVRNKIFNDKGG